MFCVSENISGFKQAARGPQQALRFISLGQSHLFYFNFRMLFGVTPNIFIHLNK